MPEPSCVESGVAGWVIYFCLLTELLQISAVVAFPPPECAVTFPGAAVLSRSLSLAASSDRWMTFLLLLDCVYVTLQFFFFILMFV